MSDAYGSGDYSLVPVEHDPFSDVGASMARHLTGNPAAGPGVNPAQAFLDWRNSGQSWADQYHDYAQRAQAGPQAAIEAAGNPMDLFGGFVGSTTEAPLFHGSPISGLKTLLPSDRGPLGPGVYTSPSEQIAEMYNQTGGQLYQLPQQARDIFRGAGHRTDEEWFGFKDDKQRLINAAEPENKDAVSAIMEKVWSNDGYPAYQNLVRLYKGDEGAQALFKRAGFQGVSGLVDGPETLLFGEQPLTKGITAYHGSPYDFSKFDLSKIGTGEGAQAYGHGIYLAENPSVAESYRAAGPAGNVPAPTYKAPSDVLTSHAENFGKLAVSDPTVIQDFGSLDVKSRGMMVPMVRGLLNDPEVGKAVVRLLPVDVMDMLGGKQFTPEALLNKPSMLVNLLPSNANDLVPSRVKAMDVLSPYVARATAERPLIGADSASMLQKALATRGANQGDLHVRSEVPYPSRVGNMYQVSIAADPEHFLDWDKPLSEQSPQVQAIAKQLRPRLDLTKEIGSGFYDRIRGIGQDQSQATEQLRQAGIPGIKYLDQGSRGSGTGTHNYVVFSDDIISILKKYGIAGLIAAGASHFSTTPVDHNPYASGMARGGRVGRKARVAAILQRHGIAA